jgi:hypothetical protein
MGYFLGYFSHKTSGHTGSKPILLKVEKKMRAIPFIASIVDSINSFQKGN